jgi:hypothetical protein
MATRRHLAACIVAALGSLVASVTFGQDTNANRTVLIFLDDLHIEFRNTPSLRTGIHRAIERLLAAGRAIAIISDGPSSVAIRPTIESAPLLQVANRITGGGLTASDVANPTPAITADIMRRQAVAGQTFQSSLSAVRLEGILYVTERQTGPTPVSTPFVITRPEGMDAAVAELLSVN